MPYYDYECESCGEIFEESLTIARRNEPTTKPCPQEKCEGSVKMRYATPYVGDPWHFARKKIDDGFKDKLKDIKSKHLHSTINV
jgi:putative FmdB family regulatory protein